MCTWISVQDRLPEQVNEFVKSSGEVLITHKVGKSTTRVKLGVYDHEQHAWVSYGEVVWYKVTHWASIVLPESIV